MSKCNYDAMLDIQLPWRTTTQERMQLAYRFFRSLAITDETGVGWRDTTSVLGLREFV